VIASIFEPLMDNQLLLQQKIEFDMVKQINDLNDRMSAAEYVIYKTETPDTRFTAIYDKLTHVETTREKDVEDNKYLRSSLEKKCD